jgi:hypothetical protein
MPQIKYISEPAEYFDMLTSDQILVMGINFVRFLISTSRHNTTNFLSLTQQQQQPPPPPPPPQLPPPPQPLPPPSPPQPLKTRKK